MLIIGLMSGLTLPTMSRVLAKHPEMHERLLTPLLAALQFGDVSLPLSLPPPLALPLPSGRLLLEAGVNR
jgi:hypothetical protein